ncbi:MAG TPA: anti-sigma factor [Verrucomicrobiae bacterium]|jgi:anti-sigma factor RsiW|nr:anti-sigma factor [Verrucomicrobiae bacterium]
MNCQQAKPLIDAYADGELEASAILELEQHLHGCPACAAALRNVQNLKQALKQDAFYFTAPAELERRIRAQLPASVNAVPQRSGWISNWNWLTTAMSGAFAVCLALLVGVTLSRSSPEQALTREVVSSHIRSLIPGHTLDVVSTDQHTVKPWFNGKVDFSPPVKNLAAQEFPLVGGRLDYLNGRNVAALVFQRHKHVINLFVWPASVKAFGPSASAPLRGFNVIHWSDGQMNFWAVSDLNQSELMEFVRDFAAGKTVGP